MSVYSTPLQVITIFSASNYYETGSNKGAYLKLTGSNLSIHFIQFTTFTNRMKKMTFRQRVGLIESSALRELSQKIISVRHQLMEEFKKFDSHDSGRFDLSYLTGLVHYRRYNSSCVSTQEK